MTEYTCTAYVLKKGEYYLGTQDGVVFTDECYILKKSEYFLNTQDGNVWYFEEKFKNAYRFPTLSMAENYFNKLGRMHWDNLEVFFIKYKMEIGGSFDFNYKVISSIKVLSNKEG